MPLDTAELTDWDSVYPVFKTGGEADGQTWVAVAQGGPAGVGADPDTFPAGVTSYRHGGEDLGLTRDTSRWTVRRHPTPSPSRPSPSGGFEDPYNLTDEQVQEVADYFIAHKDQFRAFFEGDADLLSLYRNEEIKAAAAFPGYEATLAKEGMDIGFNFAEEGTLTWMCGMGISANAENVPAAYAWLNHFLSTYIHKYFAEKWNYLASNEKTLGDLEPEDDRRTPDGGPHVVVRGESDPDRRQLRRVAGRDASDQVGMTGGR